MKDGYINVKKIIEKLDKLYSTEWGRWIISFVVTTVFFAVLYVKSPIVFFINDDENIMYTLAGYYTNGVTADHSFVNFVLGKIIRILYELLPMIPWYGVFHVFMLYISILIIGKSVLKVTKYNDISWFWGMTFFSVMDVLLYIYPVILMQFTTTSAMTGTAAIVLLLCVNSTRDNKKSRILDYILIIVLMTVCYMHRRNTGNVMICYFFLIGGYQIVKCKLFNKGLTKKRQWKMREIVVTIICVLSSIALVIGISNSMRNTEQWDAFRAYDESRYKMTDYPHDSIYENPELYEKIDWTIPLYEIAGKQWWFFMDERINVESFNEISKTGYYSMNNTVQNVWNTACTFFSNDIIPRTNLTLCIMFAFCGLLSCFLQIKRNWLDILLICCTAGGAALMCFYLCWKDRFILRAFHVVVFASSIVFLIVFLNNSYFIQQKFRKLTNIKKNLIIVALGIVVLCVGALNYWKVDFEAETRVEKSQRTLKVEEYAINHPEDVYIYDASLTFRYFPFTIYDEFPSNLFFWGGMGWNSPAFYEQLSINGLDNLYSDVFFEENVYYVSYTYYSEQVADVKGLLFNYMQEKNMNVVLQEVDSIDDGIIVYKFSKSE